jgi:hypothetical protein
MRTRWTLMSGILAVLMASGAAAATLDRSGSWTPPKFQPPLLPTNLGDALINDGSFELGPPPASAWTEVANPTCGRIGDFTSVWYVSAYDGTNDYWAGGYCDGGSGNVPLTSSVTQTITIPTATPQLSFHYIAFRPDADDAAPDGDHAYVAANGAEVWTLPLVRASDTYPEWSEAITVDLSAYADQSIALTFGGISEGGLTGNIRFDFIELTAGPAIVETATWGAVKALYR